MSAQGSPGHDGANGNNGNPGSDAGQDGVDGSAGSAGKPGGPNPKGFGGGSFANFVQNPVIASLDLTNPTAVTALVNLQQSGVLGGKLVVSKGVVTGGTIIFTTDETFPNVSAENIPKGVTATFQNFTNSDPIIIKLTGTSTTPAVTINGTQQFLLSAGASFSNALINITSTASGTVLTTGSTGKLTSFGTLAINAQGTTSGLSLGLGTSTAPLTTSSHFLFVNTDPSGAGGAFVKSLSSVILGTSQTGGALQLSAAGNLTVFSSTTISAGGSMTLVSSGKSNNALIVGGGSLLQTTDGNITLQNTNAASGQILLGSPSTVHAQTPALNKGSGVPQNGNVVILVGTTLVTTAGHNPGVTETVDSPGTINYGPNPFTLEGTGVKVKALGANVTFDNSSKSAGAIDIGSNATIIADPPLSAVPVQAGTPSVGTATSGATLVPSREVPSVTAVTPAPPAGTVQRAPSVTPATPGNAGHLDSRQSNSGVPGDRIDARATNLIAANLAFAGASFGALAELAPVSAASLGGSASSAGPHVDSEQESLVIDTDIDPSAWDDSD